jgi:hypothetical protein
LLSKSGNNAPTIPIQKLLLTLFIKYILIAVDVDFHLLQAIDIVLNRLEISHKN